MMNPSHEAIKIRNKPGGLDLEKKYPSMDYKGNLQNAKVAWWKLRAVGEHQVSGMILLDSLSYSILCLGSGPSSFTYGNLKTTH